MDRLKQICKNCFDYDKGVCQIRFVINKELKERKAMKRKPHAKACDVFMYKPQLDKE